MTNKLKFLSLTLVAFSFATNASNITSSKNTTALDLEICFNDQQKHTLKNSSIEPVFTDQVNDNFIRKYKEILQKEELNFDKSLFEESFKELFWIDQGGNHISIKFDYSKFNKLLEIKKEDGSFDRLKSLFYKEDACLTLPYELCLKINIDDQETKEVYFDRIQGSTIYLSNDKYEKGYTALSPTQCSSYLRLTILDTPNNSRKTSDAGQHKE